MGVVPNHNTVQIIKKLVPLNMLSEEDFELLLQSASFNKDKAGTYLFRQGDTDYHNVYLLSGQVALLDKMREVDRVIAGSETARFPLAHQIPRKNSVRAIGRVEYVLIDNRKLSELLVRSSDDDYKVTELNSAVPDDWMAQLLQSQVFQQIPAANIQGVIMRMEEIKVKRGENVIEQGGEGDYFYLIHQGRCTVQRKEKGDDKPTELVKLGPGDSFGEEALLSDSPRNSTVRMLSKGILLRLAKEDFIEFVKRPLAKGVRYEKALSLVKSGAVWLDVRPPEEYETGHIGNSVSLPLDNLRYQATNLAVDRHYVICCGDGQMSATAAFLLTDRGYHVSVLEGGFRSVSADILIQEGGEEEETSAKVISLHSGEEMTEDATSVGDSKELEDLRDQLAAAKNKNKELGVRFQGFRDKQQKEASKRQAELKARKVILDSTRNRLEELRAERNSDRKALELLQRDKGELDTALADMLEELNRASSSTTDLESRLQAEQDSSRKIAQARDDLQQQLHKLQQQLEQQRISQQEAEARMVRLEQEHKLAVTGLDEELGLSRGMLEDAIASRQALEKTVDDLRQGQTGIEQQHNTVFSEFEQQLEQLRKELNESQEKHNLSLADLEQLKSTLNESEAGLDGSQQARQESEAELKALQSSHQLVELELQELRDSYKYKESELEELKTSYRQTETDLQHERVLRQDAEAGLEREAARTSTDDQDEVKVLHSELTSLTGALEEADFAYDEIRERVELLSEQKGRTTEQIEELESNSTAAREEIEALTSELEQLRSVQGQPEAIAGEAEEIRKEADALREELNLLQLHSGADIEELRSALQTARSRLEEFEAARGLEKADEESTHLELEEFRESSRKWEQRLSETDEKCRTLEDAIEDRDKKIDLITLELDEARLKYTEAESVYRQHEERLNSLLESSGQEVAVDEYVDPRLAGPFRTLHLDDLSSGYSFRSSMLLWFLLGASISFVVLDGVMILAGRGELVTTLLQGGEIVELEPGDAGRATVTAEPLPGRAPEATATTAPVAAAIKGKRDKPEPVWSILTGIELGPVMVKLTAGKYTMGSNRNQVSGNEWPAHTVEIKAFAISREEVTFDEYDHFAQATGRRLPDDAGWGRGKHPVINVSWDDAVAYTGWLSGRTGKNYRLPTESEWEFAVRGGSDATYWWGYQVDQGRANCFDCGSKWDRKSTAPVGSFPANGFGLHDMAGNVREWIQDCYHPNYKGAPANGSVRLEPGCGVRVVRGGAYNKTSDSMRSSWRGHFKQGSRLSITGFRVVREL